jgi:hypothetical protein
MKRWLPVLILCAGLGSSFSFAQYRIVDCVEQKAVTVRRVQGQVFDPNGVPVPGVIVSLSSEAHPDIQSKTGAAGEFSIKARPGRYVLKALYPNFETTRAELDIGEDVISIFHPTALRIILALHGMNCPWVTANKKEFNLLNEQHRKQK